MITNDNYPENGAMDVGEGKSAEAIDLVDKGSDNEKDQVEHEVHSLFGKKRKLNSPVWKHAEKNDNFSEVEYCALPQLRFGLRFRFRCW